MRDRYRPIALLAVIGIVLLLASAYYMEYRMGLEPCPLCLSQRAVLVLMLLVWLLGLFTHQVLLRRLYALFAWVFALAGGYFAGRQVWLQSLPADQVPDCMPEVGYLFEVLPFWEFLQHMVSGTGDCAEISWSLWGISIPGYTLIAFCILGLLSWVALFSARPKRLRAAWLR